MNVNKQQRSCSTRNRRLPLFSILEPLSSLTKPIPSIAIAVNQVFVVYYMDIYYSLPLKWRVDQIDG
jgi:hypothetical protein